MRIKVISALLFICLLLIGTSYVNAGIVPVDDLGDGPGCSALSKPEIDCTDLDIVLNGPAEFCGTMGFKGIQVRSNMSNDTDTDGESDGVEACICDAIDNNPNININPGDGSVCDSSIPEERDQFNGEITVGPDIIQGNKAEFCYEFSSFPSTICPQTE